MLIHYLQWITDPETIERFSYEGEPIITNCQLPDGRHKAEEKVIPRMYNLRQLSTSMLDELLEDVSSSGYTHSRGAPYSAWVNAEGGCAIELRARFPYASQPATGDGIHPSPNIVYQDGRRAERADTEAVHLLGFTLYQQDTYREPLVPLKLEGTVSFQNPDSADPGNLQELLCARGYECRVEPTPERLRRALAAYRDNNGRADPTPLLAAAYASQAGPDAAD